MPQIYYSQPLVEFVEDVRFRAAQNAAPPVLIAKLDELIALAADYDEDAIDEARAEGYEEAEKESAETIRELENEVDALRDTIRDLEAELENAKQP